MRDLRSSGITSANCSIRVPVPKYLANLKYIFFHLDPDEFHWIDARFDSLIWIFVRRRTHSTHVRCVNALPACSDRRISLHTHTLFRRRSITFDDSMRAPCRHHSIPLYTAHALATAYKFTISPIAQLFLI